MKCLICSEEWPDAEGGLQSFEDHMRVIHPDQYEPAERWPDGALVIHDDTLTPEDFA